MNSAIKLEKGERLKTVYRLFDLFPPKNWVMVRKVWIWKKIWATEYRIVVDNFKRR